MEADGELVRNGRAIYNCRRALVRRCMDLCDGDVEKTIRIVQKVVDRRLDFLVDWCNPPIYPCFIANWARSKNQRSYFHWLSRSFLLTVGMELPAKYWDDPLFVEAFREEAYFMIQRKTPPQFHNLRAAREHPRGGSIIQEAESLPPPEIARYAKEYQLLLDTMGYGFPSVSKLEHFLGKETARYYENYLKFDLKDDLDIEECLEAGKSVLWQTSDCERIFSLLAIYVKGHRHGDSELMIGERYMEYKKNYTQALNAKQARQIQEAHSFGGWRMRNETRDMFREKMTEGEWAEYVECETAMKRLMPKGCYSKVPRRFYTDKALLHMRRYNLKALRKYKEKLESQNKKVK